jgi:hypothetical protein
MASLAMAEDAARSAGWSSLVSPCTRRTGQATRAAHLARVEVPMPSSRGRGTIADAVSCVASATTTRRQARAVVDGADHSFHLLKRSGRTDESAQEIADVAQPVS